MTLELIPDHARKASLPPLAETSVFRELPRRRPAAPAEPASQVQWTLVDIDRYRVTHDGTAVGYIDVVGAVFVALRGARPDRALEVAQTLIFEDAVAAVDPRASSS